MCKGKIACKSCAKVSKKHSSSIKGISMKKINFSIAKKAAAGVVGFAAAKLINKIPKVGDNALISGGVKIAAAVVVPGLVGKKVPYIEDIAVGVAIAGFTDLVRKYLPGVAPYIAAPGYPSGDPYTTRRMTRNNIACPGEVTYA